MESREGTGTEETAGGQGGGDLRERSMALTSSIRFHRPPSEYSMEYSVTDSLLK